MAQLDHGNSAARCAAQTLQDSESFQGPGDDRVDRFGVVGKPDRTGGGGSDAWSNFFRQDAGAIPAFGEEHGAGQPGNARANNSNLLLHPDYLRVRWRSVILTAVARSARIRSGTLKFRS